MKKMSYFTEVMRICKVEEKGKAIEVLNKFLKNTSFTELKEITRESRRGAELVAMKTNPALVGPFVETIDKSESFHEWISNFSRSWNLLN